MLEFAKEKRSVYLPWKVDASWTFPSVLLKTIAAVKECVHHTERERKWEKFLTAVQNCAAKYKTARELYDAQFRMFGCFYKELEKE